MTTLGDGDGDSGPLRFAKDFIGLDYHHEGHSHIDALCHAVLDGALYNGRPQSSLTAEGASADAIEALKDGLVGRGILLDVPRLRESPGSSRASTCWSPTSRAASACRG